MPAVGWRACVVAQPKLMVMLACGVGSSAATASTTALGVPQSESAVARVRTPMFRNDKVAPGVATGVTPLPEPPLFSLNMPIAAPLIGAAALPVHKTAKPAPAVVA